MHCKGGKGAACAEPSAVVQTGEGNSLPFPRLLAAGIRTDGHAGVLLAAVLREIHRRQGRPRRRGGGSPRPTRWLGPAHTALFLHHQDALDFFSDRRTDLGVSEQFQGVQVGREDRGERGERRGEGLQSARLPAERRCPATRPLVHCRAPVLLPPAADALPDALRWLCGRHYQQAQPRCACRCHTPHPPHSCARPGRCGRPSSGRAADCRRTGLCVLVAPASPPDVPLCPQSPQPTRTGRGPSLSRSFAGLNRFTTTTQLSAG